MAMPPKRKALLVGISHVTGTDYLAGPGQDVKRMRGLLHNVCHYDYRDIVVLLDSWIKKERHRMPTNENINILTAIDDLVKDCRPGDQFVFHCESSHNECQKLAVNFTIALRSEYAVQNGMPTTLERITMGFSIRLFQV